MEVGEGEKKTTIVSRDAPSELHRGDETNGQQADYDFATKDYVHRARGRGTVIEVKGQI